ncbi:phage tail protein [Limnohabitans sp.]|jgi:microcystin-dependent protein|uniref:phage tail protein n=1 Tax=Limnohabitans sp. TaxID=1907725 RepID=UPI002B001FC5|nr:tail fiber protein [Limnohabitans sp.]
MNTKIKMQNMLLGFFLLSGGSAFACSGADPFIGSVCMTAAKYCPDGYLEANGQLLQVNQYQALYALMGITYGGSTGQNFNLPNMQGRVPVGVGKSPSGLVINLGQQRGSESVPITTANLPAHVHTLGTASTVSLNVSMNTANNRLAPDATFNKLAASALGPGAANIWSDTVTNPVKAIGGSLSGSTDVTGSNLPLNVISPQLALKYCVATTGLWPPMPN